MRIIAHLGAVTLLAVLGACSEPSMNRAGPPAGMPMTTATTPADMSPAASPGQANYDPASITASQPRGGRR